MFVKQVSIFVENKKGTVAEAISLLGNNGINIRALSVADTSDYGILRLIVNNPLDAEKILKEAYYTVKLTDVLGFAVPDKPNGLGGVLSILNNNNVEIAYIYSFVGHYKDQAVGIIRTSDLEETKKILVDNNVTIIDGNEIYKD